MYCLKVKKTVERRCKRSSLLICIGPDERRNYCAYWHVVAVYHTHWDACETPDASLDWLTIASDTSAGECPESDGAEALHNRNDQTPKCRNSRRGSGIFFGSGYVTVSVEDIHTFNTCEYLGACWKPAPEEACHA